MSQNINIQLELNTVLTAIRNGESSVLAEVIAKLLMADYEIFKQLNELGEQFTSFRKTQLNIQDRLINLEPIEDEEVEILDADTDD